MTGESTSPASGWLRSRRRARLAVVGLSILLAVSCVLDRVGLFGYRGDDWAQFDRQTCEVETVVDGDTIRVRCNGRGATVRLLGIDAPEMNYDSSASPEHWAERSRVYAQTRLSDREVVLRLEQIKTRDRYGRLLAYVYLSDTDNLNLALVRDGQAYADRRFAHSLRPQFELAEAEARRQQRGLWKDLEESQMPRWRQQWLERIRSRRANARGNF